VEVRELHLRTAGPDDTRAVAAVVARHLELGDVIALSGELGAGKTCFVQGAAAELGVDRAVTSPTFVLVRHYEGRVPVVHCDVYRLDRLGDVLELGDEVLAPDVVTFVEWGDAIATLLPDDRIEVDLRSDGVATDAPADDADAATTSQPRVLQLRLRGRTTARGDLLAAALGHDREVRDRVLDRAPDLTPDPGTTPGAHLDPGTTPGAHLDPGTTPGAHLDPGTTSGAHPDPDTDR
jgi:tRNA threonylcarbamoyladenosine biosynthesis protein TsaE